MAERQYQTNVCSPLSCRELIEHTELSFNDNGTVTTVPKHPLVWDPEKSVGKEDDILVLPNIALLVSSMSS
jgi:hypothetical protein